MPSSRGLPFGRPPQQPSQNQFVDERRRSLPAQDGVLVSTAPIHTPASAQAQSADLAIFFPLPLEPRDTIVTEARISVAAGAAGLARVALYTFDIRERIFKQVPGTAVAFSTASAVSLSEALPHPVRLVAGTPYFAAFKVSSAVPTFYSVAVPPSGAGVNGLLYRAEPTGALGTTAKLSDLTRTTGPCPIITYISDAWKDVI